MNVGIRPYRLDDSADLVAAALESVAEVGPWMPWCHSSYSHDEARPWLESQIIAFDEGTDFQFAIVSDDNVYLGGCGLNQLDGENRRANLGYWVRSGATKRGVATAAVAAVQRWAFVHTDLIRLEILVAATNHASQRVAMKAGAVREGLLMRRLVLHGAAHDAIMFSITRPLPAKTRV